MVVRTADVPRDAGWCWYEVVAHGSRVQALDALNLTLAHHVRQSQSPSDFDFNPAVIEHRLIHRVDDGIALNLLDFLDGRARLRPKHIRSCLAARRAGLLAVPVSMWFCSRSCSLFMTRQQSGYSTRNTYLGLIQSYTLLSPNECPRRTRRQVVVAL